MGYFEIWFWEILGSLAVVIVCAIIEHFFLSNKVERKVNEEKSTDNLPTA